MSGVRGFDLGKNNLVKNMLVEIQLSKNNDLIENDYPQDESFSCTTDRNRNWFNSCESNMEISVNILNEHAQAF